MVGDYLGVNELHLVDVGRWRRSRACAGRMRSESDVKVAVLSLLCAQRAAALAGTCVKFIGEAAS